MPRYADMFVNLDTDPRADPPGSGDERTTLLGFLAWQRGTLELKCAGLTPAQLARRPLDPSLLSLLGLVRHLADVERGWVRGGLAKQDAPAHYPGPDEDFLGAVEGSVEQAFAVWRAEAEFTDSFAREAPWEVSIPDADRGPLSLRWVLVHLIEEYARHNGHADILREQIDGRVGQ